ncbi:MAG: Pseudouridine synthase [Myxococcaceae bacterium]|nr:Pseudouridine synthase [Myxococcaceae bacterium]
MSAAPLPHIEVIIEAAEAGERLDRVLSSRPLGVSRAVLQRWMDEGRVTVGDKRVAAKDKARHGAVVRIEPGPPPVSDALPEAIPLDVLHEDAALIVLHKPAGLVVHPAAGHPTGTLVNALLHHTEVERGDDPRRPGVVHRLDKDTSGVMVVARTDAAREGLTAQFSAHTIEREYQAICLGAPPAALVFETLIGRHPTDRKKFSSRVKIGKRAVTHMARERELRGAALVRCRLETGRTHQIRVHMADAGYPLLGDPLYGKTPKDALLKAASEQLARQALHARVLGFVHPITGQKLRFEVEPPQDFARALALLEK